MPENQNPKAHDMDEPVKIDLDPETALRGLLKVEPEPHDKDDAKPQGEPSDG
jgi:hypothetical protein